MDKSVDEFWKDLQSNTELTENPVKTVDIEFRNTRTNPRILKSLVGSFSDRQSIVIAYAEILQSVQNLEHFQYFKKIDLKFQPGDETDSFKVVYDFKDKLPYFFNASHFIDKAGNPSVQTKFGLKNYFGLFEKIQFEYSKALQRQHDMNYELQVEFPYFYQLRNSLTGGYSYQNRILNSNFQEANQGFFFNFRRNDVETITIEDTLRTNLVMNNNDKNNLQYYSKQFYFKNEDFLPSHKFSIKYNKLIYDKIDKFLGVDEGDKFKVQGELTVPILSQTQLLKGELTYKKYYALDQFKHLFKSLRKMNFEQSFNIGMCKSLFGDKLRINDCFTDKQMRGISEIDFMHNYQSEQNNIFTNNLDFFIKNTNKFNVYNFPGLKNTNIQMFMYFSSGYFYRKINGYGAHPSKSIIDHLNNHTRLAGGLGIGLDIGMGAKLELLYNAVQKNRQSDAINSLELKLVLDE